jgi:hypothetical protein
MQFVVSASNSVSRPATTGDATGRSRRLVAPLIFAPLPFFRIREPGPILRKARQAARLVGVFLGLGLAGSLSRPFPEL